MCEKSTFEFAHRIVCLPFPRQPTGKTDTDTEMGCELGKLASSTKSDGVNATSPSEPPPPLQPDPRLPLTARQKYTMIASWKGISRAMQPTGINMFIK